MPSRHIFLFLFLCVSAVHFSQNLVDPKFTTANYVIQPKSMVELNALDFSGKFTKVNGRVVMDLQTGTPTSFDLIINISSLDLGIQGMTAHAKSSDYFDATLYPTITFFGDSIIKQDSINYVVGMMTSKGISISKVIPFMVQSFQGKNLKMKALFNIKRSEYNIGPVEDLSDEVAIEATLYAKKKD